MGGDVGIVMFFFPENRVTPTLGETIIFHIKVVICGYTPFSRTAPKSYDGMWHRGGQKIMEYMKNLLCICMYTCIYVYIHVYMYICIHVKIYVYIYIQLYICIHVHIYVYINIYLYTYISICIYMSIYVNVCIYMCLHM